MKKVEREELCRRCGECCRIKYEIGPGVFSVDGDRYCPHLEWLPDGRAHCEVYGMNHHRMISLGEEVTMCLSADEMAKAGLLPEYCPYTEGIPNYRCRVIGYIEKEILCPPSSILGKRRSRPLHSHRGTTSPNS